MFGHLSSHDFLCELLTLLSSIYWKEEVHPSQYSIVPNDIILCVYVFSIHLVICYILYFLACHSYHQIVTRISDDEM